MQLFRLYSDLTPARCTPGTMARGPPTWTIRRHTGSSVCGRLLHPPSLPSAARHTGSSDCGRLLNPSSLPSAARPCVPQDIPRGGQRTQGRALLLACQKAVNPRFGARALILKPWRAVKKPPTQRVGRLVVSGAFLQSAAPKNSGGHIQTCVWDQVAWGV